MNSLLLLNLLLGTLMVVPDLSKGQKVVIDVPKNASVGETVKIKCSFSGFGEMKILVLLVNGTEEAKLEYQSADSAAKNKAIYTNDPKSKINFETEDGTTKMKGAFTFVIDKAKCEDYTLYRCIADSNTKSQIRELGAPSVIESFVSDSPYLIVNKTSTFTCKGTIGPTGTYYLDWFRGVMSTPTTLYDKNEVKVADTQACTRTIENQLTYFVKESDYSNLTLWCSITNGARASEKKIFMVQEAGFIPPTTVKPPPQTTNSAVPSNKIKTLVMALNCILIFLILF